MIMLQSQRPQLWARNCEVDSIKSQLIMALGSTQEFCITGVDNDRVWHALAWIKEEEEKQPHQHELTPGSTQKCRLGGVEEFIWVLSLYVLVYPYEHAPGVPLQASMPVPHPHAGRLATWVCSQPNGGMSVLLSLIQPPDFSPFLFRTFFLGSACLLTYFLKAKQTVHG